MSEKEQKQFEVFKKAGLFAWMASEQLQKLAALSVERRYETGAVIHEAGSEGSEVAVVAEGAIRFVSGDSDDPNAQQASSIESGETYGEMCLTGPEKRTAKAIAVLPTVLYVLEGEAIGRYAKENPDPYGILTTNLARVLARKLRRLNALRSGYPEEEAIL